MMLLVILNLVLLVVLLIVRPTTLLWPLIRTIFALLLSMYALYLTRELQIPSNLRASKLLAIITSYALIASAVFLWLVGNLPWWMIVGQWITVIIYATFGGILASIISSQRKHA
jgi:hypothetical protein